MTKRERILKFKKILSAVENTEMVMHQQISQIACLKREINAALDELGNSEGAHRKVQKFELSDEMKLKLMASLPKGTKAAPRINR